MADQQDIKTNQEIKKLLKDQIVARTELLKLQEKGSKEYRTQLDNLKKLKAELVKNAKLIETEKDVRAQQQEIQEKTYKRNLEIRGLNVNLTKQAKRQASYTQTVESLSNGVSENLKKSVALQANMAGDGTKLSEYYGMTSHKLAEVGGHFESLGGMQDRAVDLSLEMAQNYGDIGTSGFDLSGMKSQITQLGEEAAAKKEVIKSMLHTVKDDTLKESLMAELKALEDVTKGLSSKEKALTRVDNLTKAAQAELAKPFEMMKGAIESLPMGGFISEYMDMGGVMDTFADKTKDSLAAAFDPTNPMTTGLAIYNIKVQGQMAAKSLQSGFAKVNAFMGGMLGPMLLVVGAILLAGKVMKMFFGGTMEARKELGITTMEAAGLQNTINSTAMEFQFLGVSASDVKDVAMGIADNMGGVSEVSRETVSAFASLNAHMGVSGAVSTQLATTMMAIGASSATAAAGQLESVGHLARQSGVAPAKIMEDMASDMEFFSSFAKDGGVNLAKSAIMARKLGVNMATVSKMADSLLDFESSINDQMEAQMLTGKSINTDKAREMALNGDLAGMQKEIVSQVGSEAEFNRLNVVQRQAMAKAFGVSVQDLSSMVANQEKLNNMTDAQKQTQDIIAKLMEFAGKAMTGFLSAGKALLPVVAGIGVAMLVAFYPITLAVLGITAIGAGFNYLNKQVPMLGTILGVALGLITAIKVQSMLAGKSLGGGMLSGAKSLVGGLKDKLTGGSAAASVSGKGGGMGSSIAKSGKGMGAGLKGLSKGVGAVANPKVLLGLAALTLAVIGIGYALKLAAPGIKAFGEAMGGIIQSVGSALVGIIGAIGDFGVKLMTIASPTVALGLFATAGGFGALAASMAAFSAAGLLAIPAMIAVGAFNAVTGGGEGGGEKKDGVETKIEMTNQKLDKLIELMGSDGDIAQNLIGVRKNTGGFIDTINMA